MSPILSPKEWPFVVRFYRSEGTKEPYVYFIRAGEIEGEAKYWLKKSRFEYIQNFQRPHKRMIRRAAKEFAGQWLKAWDRYFGTDEAAQ